MIDPQKNRKPKDACVLFTSDGDVVEIREADTQPGKPTERHRRWMEAKWGKKKPPPKNGSTEKGA